jgi:hypothetical protein
MWELEQILFKLTSPERPGNSYRCRETCHSPFKGSAVVDLNWGTKKNNFFARNSQNHNVKI